MRLGHNSEEIRRNSKAAMIKNGRLQEHAEPKRLEGESHWDNSGKLGHHGLKTVNLNKKRLRFDSYAPGTEGDQIFDWYKQPTHRYRLIAAITTPHAHQPPASPYGSNISGPTTTCNSTSKTPSGPFKAKAAAGTFSPTCITITGEPSVSHNPPFGQVTPEEIWNYPPRTALSTRCSGE